VKVKKGERKGKQSAWKGEKKKEKEKRKGKKKKKERDKVTSELPILPVLSIFSEIHQDLPTPRHPSKQRFVDLYLHGS